MRNIHEIVKADSGVTCHDGVTTNMDIITKLDPAPIRYDYVGINPNAGAK
jgi:hypothetical protein